MISDAGVGTEYLHFELRDSLHIRLSKSAQELAEALRSIGCKIIITDLNPARGDPVPLQRCRPHSVLFDSDFWHNAASKNHGTLLPTIVTDVHHLLNESIGLRNQQALISLRLLGFLMTCRRPGAVLDVYCRSYLRLESTGFRFPCRHAWGSLR